METRNGSAYMMPAVTAGRPMKRFIHCMAWVLAGWCSCHAHAAPQAQPLRFDARAAAAVVETYMRRNGVPGAVAVVTDGPEVMLARGFGVDAEGRPVTADTRWPVASLSKSFTALAALRLAEAGVLSLDAPVVRYLPEFATADAAGRWITVRQLLAHRSGMTDRRFREKSVRPVPASLAEAVAALRSARLAGEPGTRRSYHNPNYWVAARVVEQVSGQDFAGYLRDSVLLPLGMARSTAVDALPQAGDVAAGHVRVLNRPFARPEPAWFLGGCCGVVTTADDLARWLAFQNGRGRGADGSPLLSAAGMDAMHEDLGWNRVRIEGETAYTHNGILFTFGARQYLLPEVGRGVGIAVVTNTGVGLAPLDADAIAGLLVRSVTGAPIVQPPRVGLWVDTVLACLILATLLLARRPVVRRRQRTRPAPSRRRHGVFLAVCALPLAWLCLYPAVLRTLTGRDLDWVQSLYLSPLLFAWVAALALAGLAAGLVRLRVLAAR